MPPKKPSRTTCSRALGRPKKDALDAYIGLCVHPAYASQPCASAGARGGPDLRCIGVPMTRGWQRWWGRCRIVRPRAPGRNIHLPIHPFIHPSIHLTLNERVLEDSTHVFSEVRNNQPYVTDSFQTSASPRNYPRQNIDLGWFQA